MNNYIRHINQSEQENERIQLKNNLRGILIKQQQQQDNYIPLVSPQLSAYAKPAERIRLQQKFLRQKLNQSVINNLEKIKIPPQSTKHYTDDSFSYSQKNVDPINYQLEIIGGQLLSNGKQSTSSVQRKFRRKPKTHRNIFSLYVQDSLEMAQLRQKMNPQKYLQEIMMEQSYYRIKTSDQGKRSQIDLNLMQKGKQCKIMQQQNYFQE